MNNTLVPIDVERIAAFTQLLESISCLTNEIICTAFMQEDEQSLDFNFTDNSDSYSENELENEDYYIVNYLQKTRHITCLTTLSNLCAVKAYVAFEVFLQQTVTSEYKKSTKKLNSQYLLSILRNSNAAFRAAESTQFPFEDWFNVFNLSINTIVQNNSYIAMDELGSLPHKEKKIFASYFQLQEITVDKRIAYRVSCKYHIEDVLQLIKEYAHLILFYNPGQ